MHPESEVKEKLLVQRFLVRKCYHLLSSVCIRSSQAAVHRVIIKKLVFIRNFFIVFTILPKTKRKYVDFIHKR